MARTQDSEKWTVVAWQGLTIGVPQDWNIGAIGGEGDEGYLRIDSTVMPRVEIKWAKPQGSVDIKRIVDKYLTEVSRSRKRNAPEVTVERNIKLLSKGKRKKSSLECFSWHGDIEGYGAAWYCKDCGRTIIAQVMGTQDEDTKALAERILMGVEDHPEGESARWATYGLDFAIPKDFKLEGQKLMSGLVELWFKRDTETIRVSRWGMAGVALRGTNLGDWTIKQHWKRLKVQKPAHEKTEHAGHEALKITGGTLSPVQTVQRFVQHCRGKLYADRLRGLVWHCPDDNKIYIIETFVDLAHEELYAEIADSITCHET
jgi:hypothetical protein